jgi:zinc protease
VLSRGNSSRLYRSLVKDQQLFSEIHAYMTGSFDTGMFVVEGKPLETVSIEQAEAAIWQQLELLKNSNVPADELTKVKNKTESTLMFSEMSLLDKAMNLAYYELLGDAELLNDEADKYLEITAAQIREQANRIFRKDNSSTLVYLAEQSAAEEIETE